MARRLSNSLCYISRIGLGPFWLLLIENRFLSDIFGHWIMLKNQFFTLGYQFWIDLQLIPFPTLLGIDSALKLTSVTREHRVFGEISEFKSAQGRHYKSSSSAPLLSGGRISSGGGAIGQSSSLCKNCRGREEVAVYSEISLKITSPTLKESQGAPDELGWKVCIMLS